MPPSVYDDLLRTTRFTCTRVDHNPAMDDSANMDHWRCTLTRAGRRMALTFSKGFGHQGKPPSLAEVLECCALDAG